MLTKVFVAILLIAPFISKSQDTTSFYNKIYNLPDKFFSSINKRSERMQEHLLRATTKYLNKLEKQESKMQKRLAKKDSTVAKATFDDIHGKYNQLRGILSTSDNKIQKLYSPHIDSMGTALKFLNNSSILPQGKQAQQQLQGILGSYGNVQSKLNQTEYIKQQLEARRALLKAKLENLGFNKEFKKYQADVYYYRAQLDSYKKLWEDPHKMEATLLNVISETPLFRAFFSKHSELASLFQLPGNEDISATAMNSMQTRGMITQQLGQRFGSISGASQAVSGNISNAQGLLGPLKNKLQSYSQSTSDESMPNFQPQQEKTKSILQRIELGTNIQSTKSNYFFPTTTDIGISIGYRINSKAVAGVGGSYKVGWGKDIRHIALTHQGLGLRTFANIKLKGNFWFSAGGETNYKSVFHQFEELENRTAWQKSALAGVSKKYKIKKYNGELKLLYDFLWRNQVPATQPFVFRTGYTF
jgi:hypothetical protein